MLVYGILVVVDDDGDAVVAVVVDAAAAAIDQLAYQTRVQQSSRRTLVYVSPQLVSLRKLAGQAPSDNHSSSSSTLCRCLRYKWALVNVCSDEVKKRKKFKCRMEE